jgi:hypothetical protein
MNAKFNSLLLRNTERLITENRFPKGLPRERVGHRR